MRAALYARVSTDQQSTGLQLADLRRLANARGWEVVREYVDSGVSGATTSRPELDEMLKDATRGRFGVLVVWKFDRVGRSTPHLLTVLEHLRSAGVQFVSATEGIDTSTPVGQMVFTFLSAIAEFERSLIRERVRAGVRHAREKGKRLGRPPVTVDIRRADALRRNGLSLRQVAAEMGTSVGTVRRALERVS